jgi:hypothetical protein
MHINDVRKGFDVASKKVLLSKANVVSLGIGYKTSKGKKTDKLSIICSVEQKKTKESLSEKDLIPEQINGIPTDVVQTGIIKAQSNTTKQRPALGGDSIGHYAITAGTLGCVVRKNGQLMILSNNHVLANSNDGKVGDAILQPGPYDKGTEKDQIGTLSEFVPVNFIENGLQGTDCPIATGSAGFLNFLSFILGRKSRLKAYSLEATTNLVDAALAKPLNEADVLQEIRGIGPIIGVKEIELGMEVHKQGRTTGYTKGVVDQIDVTTQVSYGTNKTAIFSDQISITSSEGSFSQPGDSGSAVCSGTYLVGLLFAGSDTTTIVNRINNVFNAFGCTL